MDLANPRNSQLIDAFRSLAMMHVVFAHVLLSIGLAVDAATLDRLVQAMPGVANVMWHTYSVDIFFLVSAFLIALPLLNEHGRTGTISLGGHFLRRVSRILPLYYLTLGLYLLVQDATPGEVLRSALFLGFVLGDGTVMDVGGWAIEALAQSYVLMPFAVLALMRTRRPLLVLGVAILAMVAGRYAYILAHPDLAVPRVYLHNETVGFPLYDVLYHRSWFRMSPFAVGLGLAILLFTRRAALERALARRANRVALLLAGLLLAVPTAWVPLQDRTSAIHAVAGEGFYVAYLVVSHTLVALGAAAILLALFAMPVARPGIFLGRLWQWLSQYLYAIFLFHPVFILLAAVAVFRSTDPAVLAGATIWHLLVIFGLAVAMTLALAVPLTRYVEQPVQRFLRGFAPGPRDRGAA